MLRHLFLALCLLLPLVGWGQELAGDYSGPVLWGGQKITFLPGNRFSLSGGDCTNDWYGIGTYRLHRKRLLLHFEEHPDADRWKENVYGEPKVRIQEAPMVGDSLCFLRIRLLEIGTGRPIRYACLGGGARGHEVFGETTDSLGLLTMQAPRNSASEWMVKPFVISGYRVPQVTLPFRNTEMTIEAVPDPATRYFIPRGIRWRFRLAMDPERSGKFCLVRKYSRGPKVMYREVKATP